MSCFSHMPQVLQLVCLVTTALAVSIDGPSVQKALQAAIARGDKEFSLPEGDIYFNASTFSVVGASGIKVSGTGPAQTRLWFSPGAGVRLVRCHNMTFAGFSIDYDPLPYTQATILAIANVTSKSAVYDIELSPRSPPLDRHCANPLSPPGVPCERYGINQLWAANGTAKAGSDFGVWPGHGDSANAVSGPGTTFIPLGGRRFRSTFGIEPVPAQVGDVITRSGRDWFTYTVANSSNVVTEDVQIYSSSGFTIMELDGACGHTYRQVVVAPKAGFMIASNADVFHSSDCMQGALIEDCRFETNLDDFVNVHSTVHILWQPKEGALKQKLGPKEFYLVQGQETGTTVSPENVTDYWYGTANPGKNLRPNTDTLSCYEVASQAPMGIRRPLLEWPVEVTDSEVVTAAKALHKTVGGGLGAWAGVRVYRVALDGGNITSGSGAAMCDLDRFNGAGLVVRHNVFAHSGHPQLGLKVKASHSVLENNQYIGNAFLNLQVQFEKFWLEGPTQIYNVSFRNERIIDCTAGPPPRTDIFRGLATKESCKAVACCPYNITYETGVESRAARDSITFV